MIQFEGTGKIIKDGWPEIRHIKRNWGSTALRMQFAYEEGYIKTSRGTKVKAYEFVKNSLKIELFDKLSAKVITKENSFFDQFNFDLSYNCFGYCFADSKVFLQDPTVFLNEDFLIVEPNVAEIIVFKEHKGFGDNGEELLINFHAVKILENGNVSFKPGINQLIENVNINLAIHNYNFNHKIYFKKR